MIGILPLDLHPRVILKDTIVGQEEDLFLVALSAVWRGAANGFEGNGWGDADGN